MRKTALGWILALASAQAAAGDDLLTLYREALEADAQFTSATAQFGAVQERVPQSRAALLPSLSATANATQNNNEGNTYDHQNYASHAYFLNLTQPLFRWDTKITYDQTKLLVSQAQAELELARQDLILRLSQAYFDVLYADDSLATIQAERAAIGEQLAAANRRFELGTATVTDVRDAQARFDLVTAQEITARNDQLAKREALRQITNRYPETLAPLASGVALPDPEPADADQWEQAAVTDSLTVIAGQAALEIARLETRKARAGHYPTVDLTAAVGNTDSDSINTVGTDTDERRIGVQVEMPIYSGGGVRARQRETAKLLEKAQADLDNARRSSALTARQAFLSTTAGLSQVKALEQALSSADTALQANVRGLELGVRANIDVLNAQQQLSATERDLTKSRYDTLIAMLRLKAAAGRLSEADVQTLNALLSP
jgi:outer membrane protein